MKHRGVGSGGTLELSTLDGSNGFVLNGVAAFDYSGRSVSAAGDVNGDGIDDLLLWFPRSPWEPIQKGKWLLLQREKVGMRGFKKGFSFIYFPLTQPSPFGEGLT